METGMRYLLIGFLALTAIAFAMHFIPGMAP